MKLISLSQNKFAKIDDEDFDDIGQWNWYYGNRGYAVRDIYDLGQKKTIYMHREIMHTPKGMDTDHLNGDKLDNRRNNLRICTHRENIFNRKLSKNNTSGYIGITFHKNTKKWIAQIAINGRYTYLGQYNTAEDAARAYDKWAKKTRGKFSKLNFPGHNQRG